MARDLIASDATIKAAIALARRQERDGQAIVPRQLPDGLGLYLLMLVQKRVVPSWRLDFAIGGKRKTLSLGLYEAGVGLALARRKADEHRKLVQEGTNPSELRKAKTAAQKAKREGGAAAGSFEAIAREFHAKMAPSWSPVYADRWLGRMVFDLFPRIGAEPVGSVTPKALLAVLRTVEARGTVDTAHELRQTAGQAFRYAIASGLCDSDPSAALGGALRPNVVEHMAALTDPVAVAGLVRGIREYRGHPVTRAALELSMLLFQRPYNMRTMRWADVDLEAALWSIPSADMKRRVSEKRAGRPHLVPLPKQAVRILRDLRPLTGEGIYCFPSLLGGARPMSENTINGALRRLGLGRDEATAHGFRATARTMMVERLNVDPEVVEAQLGHGKTGVLGAAYDRTEYVDKRRHAMTKWANYLDTLAKGGQITAIRAA